MFTIILAKKLKMLFRFSCVHLFIGTNDKEDIGGVLNPPTTFIQTEFLLPFSSGSLPSLFPDSSSPFSP